MYAFVLAPTSSLSADSTVITNPYITSIIRLTFKFIQSVNKMSIERPTGVLFNVRVSQKKYNLAFMKPVHR